MRPGHALTCANVAGELIGSRVSPRIRAVLFEGCAGGSGGLLLLFPRLVDYLVIPPVRPAWTWRWKTM
jgi:hypothetical protein